MKKSLSPAVAAKVLAAPATRVLARRAVAKVERERVDKNVKRLLDEWDIRDSDGNKIDDPKHSWLMSDKYSELFYSELVLLDLADGYEVAENGLCPALVAETAVIDAEHELIAAAGTLFPEITVESLLNCSNGVKRLKEGVDLMINLGLSAAGKEG